MGTVLFDSTVLIDLLRKKPGAVARLVRLQDAGDTPCVCAVSVEEITRGLRPSEDDDAIALFEGLEVAPLGIPEGRLAGFWRRSFARRGRTLSQADCLIAAAAVGIGARLATGNPRHFPMRSIEIEHWPVGH
ncbi:MAG: PIN domain-containing protein [Actinomycetota bacterium]